MHAVLVVDVRCLLIKDQPSSIKTQGWAVLPLFAGEVVNSGVFQAKHSTA